MNDKLHESDENHHEVWVLLNLTWKERVRCFFSHLQEKRQKGDLTAVCGYLMKERREDKAKLF